jgi:hypothetical protein
MAAMTDDNNKTGAGDATAPSTGVAAALEIVIASLPASRRQDLEKSEIYRFTTRIPDSG